MDWQQVLYGFIFNDDGIFNNHIQPIPRINLQAPIVNWLIHLKVNPQSAFS